MLSCAPDLFIGGLFIYLAEKIIRYGIFQKKGKCLYFNIPLTIIINFGGIILRYLILFKLHFFLIPQVTNFFDGVGRDHLI